MQGRPLGKLRPWLVGACAAAIFGCATLAPDLPSITEAPTGSRLPGKIVWHDLISDTPAESQRFYRELFGWEFQPVGSRFGFGDDNTYSLIRNKGRLIGGMVDANKLGNDKEISQWVGLISVPDVDKAVDALRALGGRVFAPPTNLERRGRIAVVADPQGALFALLQTRDGDPVDAQAVMGDFLWDELWTTEVGKATEFYRQVTGMGHRDYDAADDKRDGAYRVLVAGDKPRAGIMQNPFGDVPPVWVPYLWVEDPAAITARVEALGGRVLVKAQARDVGGTVAFIADPSGAGIALQTWPIRNPAENGK
jgi:predicted enzyme related to lactoylglutathione lyase